MNKKFLSVVLFGALMAGSSVTFTGCIDNDEPAGIEELRTAKAALIKANEAYRLAEVEWMKVQTEFKQVKVEEEKVQLEIQKLDLEIKKASSDYEIALWEAKKDSVIEDFKGKILDLQKTAADNETAYLKALAELEAAKVYVTDSVYSKKLVAITGDMKEVSGKITNTMTKITELSNNLLKFSSDSIAVAKEFIAADIKSGQSKLANDSVTLAEFKKLAADYSNDAVNAQILDIDKQIIAIDKKVAELKQTIIANEATVAPIEQAISKQKVAFEAKNQSLALNVPAAVESEFINWAIAKSNSSAYTALVNAGKYTSDYETKQINGNPVYSFKTAPVIKELQLGTVASDNTIDEKVVLSAKIENLATDVKDHGVELYRNAYTKLQAVGVYNLPSISTSGDITEDDKAKVAVALEKVNADFTTAETTYKADTVAFNAAYAAYKTAATAYGITQQLTSTIEASLNTKWEAYEAKRTAYETKMAEEGVTEKKNTYDTAVKKYDEAVKIVTDKQKNDPTYEASDSEKLAIYNANAVMETAKTAYETALAKVPSTDLTAAITALKAEMTAYYPKRKALVGQEFKATITGFNEGKEFVIADKLASLDAEQFNVLIGQGKDAVVGVQPWSNVSIDQTSTDKDGAVQTWIKASAKLYGTCMDAINVGLQNAKTTILPLDEVYADISTASVTPSGASAEVYVVLQYAKNAFSTIDDWTSYAEALSKTAAEKAALEAPIIAEIAKQKEALDAKYEPLRDTIYEICKLDANEYKDNVKTIADNLGITARPNTKGEKQTLNDLKAALDVTINGQLKISYTYSTYKDGKLTSASGTITTTSEDVANKGNRISDAITNIESSIEALNKYIADKKDDLASFDNESVTIAEKTKAQYEAELANAQSQLEAYQAAFAALTKAKDELIAAITK
ncbi:hypothetical protein [Phocaeicola faecalis]|uniref:hypothetical protein n=1 Tax=Phocaeicola faecalis TaxID=2786956 RepID=UPI001F343F4A|nr:hypothetical protein [Phocaeicola faecalis]